jgi:PAS domain S-box-containing protein
MVNIYLNSSERRENPAYLWIEQESRRRAIALQVSETGVWSWDIQAQKIYWTAEFEALFDYDEGTTQQTYEEWLDRVHPEDRAFVQHELESAIQCQSSEYRCDYRIKRRDGQIRWISAIGRLHPNEQDKLTWMSGLVQDITERKRTEEALQRSEALFRTTFEQTPLGCCHVGLEGQWIRVNQKLCDIVGYSRDELLQSTFRAITHLEDLPADDALIEQMLTGVLSQGSLEKRYIHKQGHDVWVRLTASVVKEEDSGELSHPLVSPSYFIVAIEDITERKALEQSNQRQTEDLERLNQSLIEAKQHLSERNDELDQFVHTASHDLKAPLRAISNLSDWIEEDLMGQIPLENQRQLQLLRKRVGHMNSLIDGLLQFSRVGRQEMAIERVDIAELLNTVIDSLAPPAGFMITVAQPMPVLDTQPLLLCQVFANLIGNGIKHHHRSSGQIKVSAKARSDHYEFAVADDGPGIPLDDREQIFGIFKTLQSQTPTENSTENTGIGLAIVKKIVNSFGGEIWLDPWFEPGSCFYFTWFDAKSCED